MAMTVKLEGLDRLKRRLSSRAKEIEAAAVSAINRTAKSTRTEASNLIRNEKGWKIKKADLDKRLSIKQARKGDLQAVLTPQATKGKGSIALPYFGAKEVKRTSAGVITTSRSKHGGLVAKRQKRSKATGGIAVQVRKGGKKAHYPKAFIAQMKSGHIGVYRRTGFTTSNNRPQIAEVKTISVWTMFRGIHQRLLEHARKRWRVEIAAQLKHQLGKKN